ncbi:hypothetical protein B0F90DRAFT_1739632, partial [Multifurca ochricompacta]
GYNSLNKVFDAAWIARCVRENFRVAIARYVLDGGAEEAAPVKPLPVVLIREKAPRKIHGKRRASARTLSSSLSPTMGASVRPPKRVRLDESLVGGDDDGLEMTTMKRRHKDTVFDEMGGYAKDQVRVNAGGGASQRSAVPHVDLAAKWRSYRSLGLKRGCVLTRFDEEQKWTRYIYI